MEPTTLGGVISIGIFFAIYFLFLRRASNENQNRYIAAFSILFYGLIYPPLIFILLAVVAIVYQASRLAARDALRIRPAVFAIAGCLGSLIFFKYFTFVERLFGWTTVRGFEIILPVGISFYVFTALGFIVDIYQKKTPPFGTFSDALLAIGFWPHLAAGPILRSGVMTKFMRQKYRLSEAEWLTAVLLILGGAAKKLFIADNLGAWVNANFAQGLDGMTAPEAWATLFGFSGQIYADFSGYSDMAIGFAAILGFRLPANFNYPFRAQTLTDFWRRWHISLSTWFRDYVFFPLGGSRGATAKTYANIAVVFLLSGVWHGAGFNFLIWGGLHGFVLIVEKMLGRRYLRVPGVVRWFITLMFVTATWAFFRTSFSNAVTLISTLCDVHRYFWNFAGSVYYVVPMLGPLLVLAVDHWVRYYRVDPETGDWVGWENPIAIGYALGTFVLAVFFSGTTLPFIYFNF